jgi:membrane associated rhomboid family serine protease
MIRFLDIRRHPDLPAGSPEAQKASDYRHIYLSIFLPLIFVALIWIVKLSEVLTGLDFSALGIFPRRLSGLIGVITSPFIHQDIKHTLSNSVPFVVLGFLLYNAYRKVAFKVILLIWIFEGLLVWIVGRQAYHIGASGVVYGIAFFLFFSGVFRLDIRSMALSLLVAFVYGGMVYGVLPLDMKVSFEAHLMGAIVGAICAWYYREIDRAPEFSWDDEEDEDQTKPKPILNPLMRAKGGSDSSNRLIVPDASFQDKQNQGRNTQIRYTYRNDPNSSKPAAD